MKKYSEYFKCPLCGNQVYITPGEEGFYCDSHGLVPPITKSMVTLEEVYKELAQLKEKLESLTEKVESHECSCSKKAPTQKD